MRRSIFLLLCTLMLAISGFAKTVVWSVPPEFDTLTPYADGVFFCQKGGKWGLVSQQGKMLLPTQYDFITYMTDGYALAGVKDGTKNKISCIISDDYGVTEVKGAYYLVNRYYTFFSEDKIPVANKAGKEGYMDTSGEIVIKCQFDKVHPFSEGLASVSKYPKAFYINEQYDNNPKASILPVEFNYGDLTFATTFYKGQAVVAYNTKSAVINTHGQKIGNYSGRINATCFNKFDYTIKDCGAKERSAEYKPDSGTSIVAFVEQNGLMGYREGTDTLLHASLSTAGSFLNTGYAVACQNGKAGLLHIIEGDVKPYLEVEGKPLQQGGKLTASDKGLLSPCNIIVELGPRCSPEDYTVNIDNGTGELKPATTVASSGKLGASFTPELPAPKAQALQLRCEVCYKGLPISRFAQQVEVQHPAPKPAVQTVHHLRISGPSVQTEKANEKDEQVVLAVVHNNSDAGITVTATLKVPAKDKTARQTLTIPANGSKKIAVVIPNVGKTETVSASIVLSSGESASGSVTLKPYY